MPPRTRVNDRPARRITPATADPPGVEDQYVELSLNNRSAGYSQIVENLSGPTGMARLLQACYAKGIPNVGTVDVGLNSFVDSVRAVFVGDRDDVARVNVGYGLQQTDSAGVFVNDPDDPEAPLAIEIIAMLERKMTQFDVNDEPLIIDGYIQAILDENGVEIGSEPKPPEIAEVEYMLPMHTVIARRRERESPGLYKSPFFSGTINASPVFEDPPYFWLASIDGSSDDGGRSYNVTYTLQRNPESWNPVNVYRDPDTGAPARSVTKPPIDTHEFGKLYTPGNRGNGSKIGQIYPTTEWRTVAGVGGMRLPENFFGPRARR